MTYLPLLSQKSLDQLRLLLMSSPTPRIRCREIVRTDIEGIARLLTNGFGNRTSDHWLRALKRLSEHPTPPGFPKYGYVLDGGDAPVGVILLIFSSVFVDGQMRVRCNVSSWYVEPAFRSHAAMLSSHALKHKHVTYFNITPAPHTLPILEAQGYARYCRGRFVAVPALSLRSFGSPVTVVSPEIHLDGSLYPSETELLLEHAKYGCISVTCRAADGRHYPFVFLPRWKFGWLPHAHLVYCRHLEEFVRFAGPLGRFLVRRGFPLVVVDANSPIPGLIGTYSDDAVPKYFKGPDRPHLGDLAYSERVMFGI